MVLPCVKGEGLCSLRTKPDVEFDCIFDPLNCDYVEIEQGTIKNPNVLRLEKLKLGRLVEAIKILHQVKEELLSRLEKGWEMINFFRENGNESKACEAEELYSELSSIRRKISLSLDLLEGRAEPLERLPTDSEIRTRMINEKAITALSLGQITKEQWRELREDFKNLPPEEFEEKWTNILFLERRGDE